MELFKLCVYIYMYEGVSKSFRTELRSADVMCCQKRLQQEPVLFPLVPRENKVCDSKTKVPLNSTK
jgi:hypothetical protein